VARRAGSQFNGPTTPDEPGFDSDENDHGRSTAGFILALDLGQFKSVACAHDNASVEYSPATITAYRGLFVPVLFSKKKRDSSLISTRLSRDLTLCLSGLRLRLAVFDGF
jgi:hypothetical protein